MVRFGARGGFKEEGACVGGHAWRWARILICWGEGAIAILPSRIGAKPVGEQDAGWHGPARCHGHSATATVWARQAEMETSGRRPAMQREEGREGRWAGEGSEGRTASGDATGCADGMERVEDGGDDSLRGCLPKMGMHVTGFGRRA